MQEANRPERKGLTQTGRLIALTDGLFATVLTVLVLQIGAPGIDTRGSAYCLNISLIGVMFIAECAYAASRALVNENVDPLWVRRFILRSLVIPGIFLASLLFAQLDLRLAGYFPLLIVPARFITNKPLHFYAQNIFRREMLWLFTFTRPLN